MTDDKWQIRKAHLDPDWQTFNQARQFCVRAPKVDYLIRLQDASGVKAFKCARPTWRMFISN